MVILYYKEVAILIGPTHAINLKVDWFPDPPNEAQPSHRLLVIDTGRAVGQTNLKVTRDSDVELFQ